MTAMQIVLAVLFAAFAVSYGWGMRGTIIGGEKGALLPGALLGVSISLFVGNGVFASYWPFFAATGALSMFYGGIEPYAQTMSHIMQRDKVGSFYENKQFKGAVGIFLKGGLWYAIAAVMLSLLPFALKGDMTIAELLILFLLIPVFSFIGTCIFNKPYQPDKNIFPKLYFSQTSREEWGGNVLVCMEFMTYAAIKGNWFAFVSGIVGMIAGGLGFLFGLLIYDYSVRKHRGKYLFGSLQEKHYIDGWKIMEHFFGAFAGGGVMLWFCINAEKASVWAQDIALSGYIHMGDTLDSIGAIAVPLLLLLTAVQYPIARYVTQKKGKEPEINIFEVSERPMISAVPLILVFLGGTKTACAVAFLTPAYVLCEKCAFEWFQKYKAKRLMLALYALFFLGCLILFFAFPSLPLWAVMALYTLAYIVSVYAYCLMPDRWKEKKQKGKKFGEFFRSQITVFGHMGLQCIILELIILFQFGSL